MHLPSVSNFFENAPASGQTEQIFSLLSTQSLELEKIISHGQATSPGYWYDQDNDEWVILIKGKAVLLFDPDASMTLNAGDYLIIPAHLKHRVEQCSDDALWLALHTNQKTEQAG